MPAKSKKTTTKKKATLNSTKKNTKKNTKKAKATIKTTAKATVKSSSKPAAKSKNTASSKALTPKPLAKTNTKIAAKSNKPAGKASSKISSKAEIKGSAKANAKLGIKVDAKKAIKFTDKKLAEKKVATKPFDKKSMDKNSKTLKSDAKPQKGFLTKIVSKLTGTDKKTPSSVIKEATKKAVKDNIDGITSDVAPTSNDKTPGSKKGKDTTKMLSEEAQAKVSQKNIAELTQEFAEKKISAASEVLLTDAEGRVLCKFSGCDDIANVEGYCRFHYLLNWKRIQLKKKILSEGKLEKYINELTAKYPDKYIDMLKGDLKSEKDFLSVVNELEIDDSDNSISDDEEDSYIEQEVQGVSSGKRSNEEDY